MTFGDFVDAGKCGKVYALWDLGRGGPGLGYVFVWIYIDLYGCILICIDLYRFVLN